MKLIGNKKAAITVMRPTRSFSLWEMTVQICMVYLRYTQLLRKNYGTVPIKYLMALKNEFPVLSPYFTLMKAKVENKELKCIDCQQLQAELESPISFGEFSVSCFKFSVFKIKNHVVDVNEMVSIKK